MSNEWCVRLQIMGTLAFLTAIPAILQSVRDTHQSLVSLRSSKRASVCGITPSSSNERASPSVVYSHGTSLCDLGFLINILTDKCAICSGHTPELGLIEVVQSSFCLWNDS